MKVQSLHELFVGLDVYLNLGDCILHYSPMCFLNVVHIVR